MTFIDLETDILCNGLEVSRSLPTHYVIRSINRNKEPGIGRHVLLQYPKSGNLFARKGDEYSEKKGG